MNKILKVENLDVYYDNTKAVDNVSFSIERGDYIAIVGPNGSGKTTLIKAILGLVTKKRGDIIHSSTLGYLPQKGTTKDPLFPADVFEIISMGKKGNKNIKKEVNEISQKIGITSLLNKRINELSGGELQKVLLARALISKAELLILDEPTSALDPNSRTNFYSLIRELNKKDNLSVIIVSHDVHTIGEYVDKILYLDRKLEFFGLPLDYYRKFEGGDYHE